MSTRRVDYAGLNRKAAISLLLSMDFTTIFIIAGVVILAIFLLIAKLAVRWMLRLAIVGLILIALLGAGVFWWWSYRLASPEPNRQRAAPGRSNSR